MTPQNLIEQRAQRIAQMAEKLGIQLAPGTQAQHDLRNPNILGSCLSCSHEGACCAFTDGDDFAVGAPNFCNNKETFDRLIEAEHANPTLSQSELDYLMMLASSITFTADTPFPMTSTEIDGPIDDCGRRTIQTADHALLDTLKF